MAISENFGSKSDTKGRPSIKPHNFALCEPGGLSVNIPDVYTSSGTESLKTFLQNVYLMDTVSAHRFCISTSSPAHLLVTKRPPGH